MIEVIVVCSIAGFSTGLLSGVVLMGWLGHLVYNAQQQHNRAAYIVRLSDLIDHKPTAADESERPN